MALVVSFLGRAQIPGAGSSTIFKIWSYRIEPGSPGELPGGHRIALALPSDVAVQDPDSYPGVPQLAGTFVQRDPSSSRQYVGRLLASSGAQTISFVAPGSETTCEVLLVKASPGQGWTPLSFATSSGGGSSHVQVLPAPASGALVFNGRPVTDFASMLPYASEVFGVYQPLIGWFGAQNTILAAGHRIERADRQAFSAAGAATLSETPLAALAERLEPAAQAVLSPVGLVNLFREFFFEFDTFLGAPAGHLWISPGGVVEVVETSTRRTLVERTAEQFEETTHKVEESLTRQDDVADAVKEDNANDTKLGISATGGVNAPIYHAEASASFSVQNTVKSSSEQTHKQTRAQSAKVASEIKRNFKTTFKTVTEATDTSSRRYVVQNTTSELVNYELRRKMRKVGVQVQHIGTRLSWQVYLNDPGRDLGLGELVHIAPGPDLSSLKKPEPPPRPAPKETTFVGAFPIRKYPGTANDPHINMNFGLHAPGSDRIIDFGNEFHLVAKAQYVVSSPAPGYTLGQVILTSARSGGGDRAFVPELPIQIDAAKPGFTVLADFLNTGDLSPIQLTFTLIWNPPDTSAEQEQYKLDIADYNAEVAELQRAAYAGAIRDRVKLVSSMRIRLSQDLRSEERQTIYGNLIRRLALFEDPFLNSEVIRQIFEVDEMLYFVAPDFWRPTTPVPEPAGEPATRCSSGRYPIPDQAALAGQTVAGWYSRTSSVTARDQPDLTDPPEPEPCPPPVQEWRVNYLITDEAQPAPLGSSLGWLIQIDGDQRRNEFLNAAWAKAVLPVRPGQELNALLWLKRFPEGQTALGLDYPFDPDVDPPEYQGLTVGEVLDLLVADLQKANTNVANVLATEQVFETGFDPLDGGFRPAEPYQIFDQWVEILPTDQVVAVQVKYDPKTGQQL